MPSEAFRLRPATPDDAGWMAELRAVVMRPDLERLGRFDPARVRSRFLDGYSPAIPPSSASTTSPSVSSP
ncbi:hypothetical protein [Frondihabitans sucicola]|uniref:hypothetical protein n=1 Tax=Frondihabitans sucicola TaxID=1268041 RepID=UPI0033063BBF